MQQILSTNSSTNFDAGIIALGAWRKDTYLGYYSEYISSFESYYRLNGYTVPSRLNLYYLMRAVLNLCRWSYCLPSGISSIVFYDFYYYYVRYSLQSFINYESYYEFGRHMDFVVNQIN